MNRQDRQLFEAPGSQGGAPMWAYQCYSQVVPKMHLPTYCDDISVPKLPNHSKPTSGTAGAWVVDSAASHVQNRRLCTWHFLVVESEGLLPRATGSSRCTATERTESCNASFGRYSPRQRPPPPRDTVIANVNLLFLQRNKWATVMMQLVRSINMKGERVLAWPSRDYNLEMAGHPIKAW